jgi:nucleoside-diphosphate-sugar epimerase
MESNKFLLLLGGTGVLGSAIVKVFKNNSINWKICCIDYVESKEADKNIILDKNDKYNEELVKKVYKEIEDYNTKYDAIINVAGGWVRGSIKSIDIFEQSESMINKNYYSSLLCKIA